MHHGLIPGSGVIAILAILLTAGAIQRADAASMAEVQQNGSLRLCANPSALPYSNLADGGDLAGFEVELAEVVAHEMGLGLGVRWVRNADERRTRIAMPSWTPSLPPQATIVRDLPDR
jgi:ABC-type amino acid transport substrate-binding protein